MSFDVTSDLLNDLPEALFVATLQGEVVYVNRALERLTGYSGHELIGEHLGKLMPQPARRRVEVIDWLARWAEDPNPDQLRYLNLEVVTHAGDVRLVSVRVSRHSADQGTWFIVILRDVTSERESVVAMRHAQLVTDRILAIGQDAVVSVDPQYRITYCNPGAERLFGYSQAEMIGQPLNMLLPDDAAKDHGPMIATFAASKEESRLMGSREALAGKRKDGSLVPLEISITKTTVSGEMILSAQIRDITERKQAETALRDSEARFRAIFESAVEAMALLTPEGEVLEINDAGRRMLPSVPGNALFWELDWWGDQRGDALAEAREDLKANVQRCRAGEVIRARTSLVGQDASSHEIDFSLIPVKPTGEGVAYILAEGRDITPVV